MEKLKKEILKKEYFEMVEEAKKYKNYFEDFEDIYIDNNGNLKKSIVEFSDVLKLNIIIMHQLQFINLYKKVNKLIKKYKINLKINYYLYRWF